MRFGTNLILTRLLVPEFFGVIAIASTIIVGLAMFSDLGIKQNIVQSPRGSDPVYLNTAWSIQIGRGAIIWLIALCASLGIWTINFIWPFPSGSVYAFPTLPYVIAILSFSSVIQGFESTKLYEASRQLHLGQITSIEVVAQLAGLICIVFWVAFDRSIWALVAGSLCSALARVALSHSWVRGISNRFQIDRTFFWEIIKFGRWIFFASIIGFFVNNGDRLILSALVSAKELGVYVIAYLIYAALEQVLSKIIGDVAFPVFSEMARDRPQGIKEGYYKIYGVIAAFSFFCAGFFALAAKPIVHLLYDRRYDAAGWMLAILSLSLITVPFRVATYCLMALGKPQILSHAATLRLISLCILTPIFFHFFNIAGAIWGITLSNFCWLPLQIGYNIKYGLFDFKREVLQAAMLVAGALVGVIFCYFGNLILIYKGMSIF